MHDNVRAAVRSNTDICHLWCGFKSQEVEMFDVHECGSA